MLGGLDEPHIGRKLRNWLLPGNSGGFGGAASAACMNVEPFGSHVI